jgi:hypothetical protein
MVDSQFFYDWQERSYTIEKSVLEKVKSLKGKVEESGYYDDMVKWYFDGTDEELQDLWITMQFLAMTAEPTKELFTKYNLTEKKYLINLMRQLYLDADNHGDYLDADNHGDSEGNSVMMGYKRPFGNSHVEGDVREELEICGVIEKKDDDDEDYDDNDYELERAVLKEFSNFIIDFFAGGFELRWYGFEKAKEGGSGFSPRRDYDAIEAYWESFGMDRIHSHMTQWKPAKSELRAIVLDKILDSDDV